MRLPYFLLIALFMLTACQQGQGPQNWNDVQAQLNQWGEELATPKDAAPMQKNSDFDERLTSITQRLETAPPAVKPVSSTPVTAEPLGSGVVKVALIVPLSGPQKNLGESMLVASQMAMQDLREKNIEVLPRDSGTTPASARRAVDDAVKEGAKLILGPVFADQVKGAQTGNVPLIGFTTDADAAGRNTYIMGFLPFEQVRRVMDFAALRKAENIIVVAPDSAYGRTVARTAMQYKPIPTETLLATTAESVDSMVAKLAPRITPQTAILMAYDGVSSRRLVAGLKKMGITPQSNLIMGTGLLDDPTLATAREVEGVYFASAPIAQRARFENRYRSVADKSPVRLASLAYDATALAIAVSRVSNDPSNPFPASQITDPNGFSGIDGVFRLGNNGLVTRNLSVLTWTAGQLREVAPAAGSF